MFSRTGILLCYFFFPYKTSLLIYFGLFVWGFVCFSWNKFSCTFKGETRIVFPTSLLLFSQKWFFRKQPSLCGTVSGAIGCFLPDIFCLLPHVHPAHLGRLPVQGPVLEESFGLLLIQEFRRPGCFSITTQNCFNNSILMSLPWLGTSQQPEGTSSSQIAVPRFLPCASLRWAQWVPRENLTVVSSLPFLPCDRLGHWGLARLL